MNPEIVILCGGVSDEREVSLKSGKVFEEELKANYNVRLIDVTERALPEGLDAQKSIIFPVFHGEFGEDGEVQRLLEERGFAYVGTDAAFSELCMDKVRTKECLQGSGIRMAEDVSFHYTDKPSVDQIIERLGEKLVLKPSNNGSTIDVYMINGRDDLIKALEKATYGKWLIEKMIVGRELSIGILNGKALGIVEIIPHSGFYDFESKYTTGATHYEFPAKLSKSVEEEVKWMSDLAFEKCGCRDYARADYRLSEDNQCYFLEINTIPGFTRTSLLPRSASCEGIDLESLTSEIVNPAIKRFKQMNAVYV